MLKVGGEVAGGVDWLVGIDVMAGVGLGLERNW